MGNKGSGRKKEVEPSEKNLDILRQLREGSRGTQANLSRELGITPQALYALKKRWAHYKIP